ncbi:MAG: hypothetical protein J6X66_00850 [Lachnospiraceae bacterium]|nr:hypothetical protein [Lachnospiraceae bacterium]
MKSETVKKSNKSIKDLLPLLFFIVIAGGWVLFYLLRVTRLLDADMSSEMVLSEILAKEHGIITPNWKYSTEIRVLNNQIFFSLFLALTKSYHISRLLSGVVLFIIYGASYHYLCTRAGLKKYFPHTAWLLFIPFSADYAYIILYGLFYIPHIAISFTAAALTLHIGHTDDKRKKCILMILLLLLSVAAGMGGPRQIVISFLPLLMLALLHSFMHRRLLWAGGFIAFAGGCAGYGINRFFLSGRYHFNSWDNINFTGFSFERAQTLIMGILHEYGYTEGSLFSAALIKNAAALLIVLGIILYCVSYLRRGEKKEPGERFVAGCAAMTAAVYFLLYLLTDMYYEDRYALPVIVFAVPLAGYALQCAKKEAVLNDKKDRIWPYIIPVGILLSVLAAGLGRYPGLWRTDLSSSMKEAADSLAAAEYTAGYASYWNGNIMTELSNGRFEMFNWDDYVDGKVDVDELYVWLQPISHYEKRPDGKIFILLSSEEEGLCPLTDYLTEDDVAFRNDSYVAYGFESREDMLYALSDHVYELDDTDGLVNGESDGSSWILHENSETSGPNMTFYAGTYELAVSGEGLDRLKISATSGFGEKELECVTVSQDENDILIYVTVSENTYHVEFNMQNPTQDDIRIDRAVIDRAEGSGDV